MARPWPVPEQYDRYVVVGSTGLRGPFWPRYHFMVWDRQWDCCTFTSWSGAVAQRVCHRYNREDRADREWCRLHKPLVLEER